MQLDWEDLNYDTKIPTVKCSRATDDFNKEIKTHIKTDIASFKGEPFTFTLQFDKLVVNKTKSCKNSKNCYKNKSKYRLTVCYYHGSGEQ